MPPFPPQLSSDLRLGVPGATGSLRGGTGALTIDVGVDTQPLLAKLRASSLVAEVVHGVFEVQITSDDDLDLVRDAVAELGLPLHRMSSTLTSLADVFLDRAGLVRS